MDETEYYITWPFLSSCVLDTGADLHYSKFPNNRPGKRGCHPPSQTCDPPKTYEDTREI